ncbi:hypothetical protein GOODEAATRI_003440 [Goodea atripinnis]|uniref:Uncharacterized protein n=1 Tax=Goodea atripinnis TaxID=208336 RepID=A0ABV0PKM8_9TELE
MRTRGGSWDVGGVCGGPGERDGVEVSQERLMSSDRSGEPPLLQEEADPGPISGGKDEAPLGSEGGSGGMVSEAFLSFSAS